MQRYLGFGLMLSVLLGLGLVRVSTHDAAFAQAPQPLPTTQQAVVGATTADLISHSFQVNGTTQCITVIDPKTKQLCVYHVELSSGKNTLMSARNIASDLQLNAFNSEKPLPREIKSMLEQQRK